MTFKIDDKIKIVEAWWTCGPYKNGDTGIITRAYRFGWFVKINDTEEPILETEMELIEEPIMNRLKGLKLKFDVTDNPELREAIVCRAKELGGINHVVACSDYLYLERGILNSGLSGEVYAASSLIQSNLDALYHLPKPKAKIIAPDGTEIELSDETWESFQAAIK